MALPDKFWLIENRCREILEKFWNISGEYGWRSGVAYFLYTAFIILFIYAIFQLKIINEL